MLWEVGGSIPSSGIFTKYNGCMSLRKYKKYNRAEEKEEKFYWIDLLFEEQHREWDWVDEFPDWFDLYASYNDGGFCHNMEEFHKMKVLTLLRKLHLNSAYDIVCERGWYY